VTDYSLLGPFVQTAALCERVLEEKDNVLSLIRVIDGWTSWAQGPDAPSEMPPFVLNGTYLLCLKAGAARGRFRYRFELEMPTGQTQALTEMDANFQGGVSGVNLRVNLQIQIVHVGKHWINVVCTYPESMEPDTDPQLISRTPLSVNYMRTT
jgi:hypothetical protein